MFKQIWKGPLAAIALGLVLVSFCSWIAWTLSADLTEQRVRGEKTAEYHDNYAEDAIAEDCLELPTAELRACIHEKIETARDHERAEQDLDAQQAMARFTKVMGRTAVVGLLLGFISITLVYRTLQATHIITKETRNAARDQSRAYVQVKSIHVKVTQDADKFYADCMFYIQNSGMTPCKRFEISGGARCDTNQEIFTELPPSTIE